MSTSSNIVLLAALLVLAGCDNAERCDSRAESWERAVEQCMQTTNCKVEASHLSWLARHKAACHE